MSRLFDGVDDQIVDAAGTLTLALNGALTMLAVCKFAAVSSWASLIETETSGGAARVAFGRNSSGNVFFADESANSGAGGVSVGTGDGWAIWAVTKATGSAAVDCHKLPIGSTRTTATAGSVGSANDTNSNVVRLGGNDDFANVYYGAAALFNKVLTTTELDGILSAKTSASITALSPIWFADYGDDFATDTVSGHTLTKTGTTTSADDPSGWVYLGGGAATKAPIWNPARYALTKR